MNSNRLFIASICTFYRSPKIFFEFSVRIQFCLNSNQQSFGKWLKFLKLWCSMASQFFFRPKSLVPVVQWIAHPQRIQSVSGSNPSIGIAPQFLGETFQKIFWPSTKGIPILKLWRVFFSSFMFNFTSLIKEGWYTLLRGFSTWPHRVQKALYCSEVRVSYLVSKAFCNIYCFFPALRTECTKDVLSKN